MSFAPSRKGPCDQKRCHVEQKRELYIAEVPRSIQPTHVHWMIKILAKLFTWGGHQPIFLTIMLWCSIPTHQFLKALHLHWWSSNNANVPCTHTRNSQESPWRHYHPLVILMGFQSWIVPLVCPSSHPYQHKEWMVGVFAFYPTAAVAENTDFGRKRKESEKQRREEAREREKNIWWQICCLLIA